MEATAGAGGLMEDVEGVFGRTARLACSWSSTACSRSKPLVPGGAADTDADARVEVAAAAGATIVSITARPRPEAAVASVAAVAGAR